MFSAESNGVVGELVDSVDALLAVEVVAVFITLKDAAHLLTIELSIQLTLESSLLKVTVILLDAEMVAGGEIAPVWSTRIGVDVPS